MGLLHNFVSWGIRVVDNVDTDIQRIGKRLGKWPLSWRDVVMRNPSKEGLLWRVPDPDVPMASTLMNVQALLVTQYEQVMVLMNGERMHQEYVTLPPGLYDFTKVRMRNQLEIIWTTTREVQLPWGVNSVLTSDGISIGAHGYYRVTIENPELFLLNLASNAQVYKEEHLSASARHVVIGVLRDLIARKSVMELQVAQPELNDACQERLQPIFERWGLAFRGMNIEGLHIPEQFQQAIAGRTIITLEKQAQLEGAKVDLTLAQLEAQKTAYLAQGEATKLLALGKAQAEIMQEQLRIGVDPVELKRIEAAESFAAHPGQGTLIDGRTQIVSELLASSSPNPTVGPVTITASLVPPISQSITPALTAGDPTNGTSQASVASAEIAGNEMTREKIVDQLEKLDELLIAGEITEQKHSEVYERLQKKLKELP